MNEELQSFAREQLKTGLEQCTGPQQRLFKLMYGRNGGKRSVEDAETMDIAAVVDEIPASQLSWAMDQIRRTLV